jgi:hypothetical protein
MNNKYLWIAVAIVAVISIVAFFNGRTVTQVIENPLGSVTSPYFVGPETCVNNLCTYVAAADFKNSTTTIVSFANPYTAATSTIDLVQLFETGVATSTIRIRCGTSYKAGHLVDTNTLMIDTGDIASSTNPGLIKSGLVNTVGMTLPLQGISFNTLASSTVPFGPGQYFVCKVTDTNGKDPANVSEGDYNGVSGTGDTFDGNFIVRIIRGY